MSAFVDQALIEIAAGSGGDGASHFHREKFAPRGGPDGGDGGRGGDILLVVQDGLRTLVDFQFRQRFEATDGQPGTGNHCTGARGRDVTIPVPVGTLVYDDETGRHLADLSQPGQVLVAARGGQGGRGNAQFASATHQAPHLREKGEPGQKARLRLELKLLADAALVGYPNVGKSTLISRLSAARPKIADYPFTTLTPNLGVVRVDDQASFVVADLPGLIEGAAEGRGLGHQFLRHLERARVVVHLLDLSGLERPDPVADYDTIRAELEAYDPHLARLPELVVGNKIDLPDGHDMADLVAEELASRGVRRVFAISAATGEGVAELRRELARAVFAAAVPSLREVQAQRQAIEPAEEDDDAVAIEVDSDGVYGVVSRAAETAVAMCDLDNDEAVMHLHRKLVRLGVIQALRDAGCGEGDVVRIGETYLDFEE